MKQISLCLLFAVAIQSLCYADVTKLPADDRGALQDASRFHEVHSIGDLSSAIVALCAEDGKLAEPAKIGTRRASSRTNSPKQASHLAATDGDYYVVHYERGGIAHSFHVLVAKLTKNDAKLTLIWHAVGGPFKDCAAFVGALRNGKLDDRLNYPN